MPNHFGIAVLLGVNLLDNMEFNNLDEQIAPEEQNARSIVADNAVNESDSVTPAGQNPQIKKKQGKVTWQKSLLMYLHDLVFLLAIVVVVFLLLFRVVVVSGTSMNNTLFDGDYLLLVGDALYREPKHGDVIVASKESFENGAPIVKRVIAKEGQWVDIDFTAGVVYVGDQRDNMLPLDEPYTLTPTNIQEGVVFPLQVQPGCIFVMGDNRNDSKDSRNPEIGMIDCREVLGKVVFLFFPGTNGGEYVRDFSRIGGVS